MQKYGIPSKFVGHPISSVTPHSDERVKTFRKKIGVDDSELLLVLLPGSRVAEVKRLLPVFLKSIELLNIPSSRLRIILPVPKAVVNSVKILIELSNLDIKLYPEDDNSGSNFEFIKSEIFSAADFAIAASGTVTLELAAHNTPMVVGYDVNWISRLIIKRLLKINHISLVNIISGKKIIPEFVGSQFKAGLIATEVNSLINDEALRTRQKKGLLEVMTILDATDKTGFERAGDTVHHLLREWCLT